MKKFYFSLASLLLTLGVFAQIPQKMSYQAILRNSSNALVISSTVGMRISIIQDSASGTTVYIETQKPTTDENGLVSIEIGGGTVVFGNFSNIDWAKGTYFVKTETDPSGGTNYTITGTSQFLSVPYALFARTSDYDSLANKPNIKDTVMRYGFSGNYSDLSDKPNIDGSETKVTTGTNLTISGTGTSANPYVVNVKAHYIGESYGGGIVFYVYDNGQHGLIAATADLGFQYCWYNTVYKYTGATGDGVGAGARNTSINIAAQINDYQKTTPQFAARAAADYSVTANGTTYGDWYLPSKYELNLLYLQRNVVGINTYGNCTYWSSTESDNNNAWDQTFYNNGASSGFQYSAPKWYTNRIRPIRAF